MRLIESTPGALRCPRISFGCGATGGQGTLMSEPPVEHRVRVRVFVDFWNFQLSLNSLPGERRFEADWQALGGVLARAASDVVDEGTGIAYQGMNVYGSYGEGAADRGLRMWAQNTLSTFSGVHVEMLPRRKVRQGPVCPTCHETISHCPLCDADMRGTEEKGWIRASRRR